MTPPRLARALLHLCVPAEHREFVAGDLAETFADVATREGIGRARRWYWREVFIALFTRWPRAHFHQAAPLREGDSSMQTFFQDLRFGARLLRRNPGFTAAAVLTLGLGMGANTTIFSWINSVLLNPVQGAAEPERLVQVAQTFRGQGPNSLSYPDYVDYRDRSRLLSIAGRDDQAVHLAVDGAPERVWAELVSGNFFDVLGVRAALGRTFIPDDNRAPGAAAIVVISHGLWQRRFAGDPAVVNRAVDINGTPFTIVGVTPRGFQGSQTALAYDIWIPMTMQPVVVPGGNRLEDRDHHWMTAFGRLAPGATVAQAHAELEAITRDIGTEYGQQHDDVGASVRLLRDASSGAVVMLRPVLLALAIVAAVVLLIACANIANLMIARGTSRSHEIAIRLSIGASRWRVVRQLLTESVLIAVGGGIVALVITRWTAGLLMLFAPPSEFPIALAVTLDSRVFLFTALAAVATVLLFGLAPAWQSSSSDRVVALKEGGPSVSGRRRLRDALVVAEVSLSLALLVAAGLCVRSMRNAQSFNPGFNPQNVLLASVDLFPAGYTADTGRVFFRQVLDRVRAIPGSNAVTLSRRVPLGLTGSSTSNVHVDGYTRPHGEPMIVAYDHVGPDYFRTLQIGLVRGRDIADADDSRANRVAVINETMARRYWGDRDPIGGRFRFGGEGAWITVVGVSRDVKYRSLNEPSRPFAYLPVLQNYYPHMVIQVRTPADPAALASAVRSAVQAIDPALPVFATRTLEAHISAASFQQRMAGSLLAVFGVLALILAAVGLYGVLAFIVGQRTREIGVRMALGATQSSVFGLIVKHGLKLTAIGSAIGIAAAYGVARALAAILFGVEPHDPVTLAAGIAVLAASALCACVLPARRATRLDPVRALRHH